jgi:PAS domain S-box-containing protein
VTGATEGDLAERVKPLDSALRQSEARLELVLQATGALVYEVDVATGHVDVAGDTRQIVGYAPEDAMSWWHQCIHPDDLARASAEFAAAIERGDERITAEYRLRHRDGSERYVWNTSTIVRDETGKAIRLLGATVDITGHKQRETRTGELQALTAALSAALDPKSVGAAIIERAMPALGANAGNVFLLDASGRTLLNMALLGYEPEIEAWSQRLPVDGETMVAEVVRIGQPIFIPTWKERLQRYPHHRTIHARDGDRAVARKPLQVEGRIIGAISLAFPTDRSFDEDDRRFMAAVADLCAQALERAQLYEAVRQGEEELQRQAALLNQAHDAIFAWEWDGPVTYWNKGAERMYGYTAEEAIGRISHELLGTAHGGDLADLLARIERQGEVERELERVDRQGRQIVVESRHQLVVAAGRRYVLEANRDITERRLREARARHLQELTEALSAAPDPATVGEAIIAHAMPPLRASAGIVYLLSESGTELLSLAARGYLPGTRAAGQRSALEPGRLATDVVRGAQPIVIGSYAERLARYPRHCVRFARGGDRGVAGLPLTVEGRTIGAILLIFPDERTFSGDDRLFMATIADLCAQALERARLYEAVRTSELRFRQFADSMPQIAWVMGGDGTTLEYLNERWFDHTGQDPGLGTETQIFEIIHPDDLDLVNDQWAEARRTGTPFHGELRLLGRDGHYRWFLSRSVPVHDETGAIVRWFGTSTDIDDTKRVEAQQRLLAELGQTLAGSLDPDEVLAQVTHLLVPALGDYDFVDLVQPDGQLRRIAWAHVDPDEQRLFDERLAHYMPMRLHPDHPISRMLNTGEPQFIPHVTDEWLTRVAFSPEHLEFMRDRRIRSQVTVPLRARDRTQGALTLCFTDASGRTYTPELLDLGTDVADRVALAVDNARLYTATHEAEAKVRRLLDAGVIGVIVTDDERILEANDHFLGMIGYTREELDAGRLRWPEMTPREFAFLDEQAVSELASRGVATPYEKEYLRRDGSRIPILIGIAALQQRPPLYICYILDLTERKRAEEEWRAFVDATAHDLRNPLTAVLGQTQLIQRRLRRDGLVTLDDGVSRLAAIASSARRATRLIDDLMDTVRLRAGQPLEFRPTPIDLVATVASSVEDAIRSSPSHPIRTEFDRPALIVNADGPRLERVIRNILDNAIKYSPDGAGVAVRLSREDDASGSWAVLVIEDRGIGIPEADLPYVFERFRRGLNVAGRIAGSGIGLTGAQQIVAQHGGTIAAESLEGQGSTFTMRLPLHSDGSAGRDSGIA